MEGTVSVTPERRPGRRRSEGRAGFVIYTRVAVNNHVLIGQKMNQTSFIMYNR